MDGVNKANGPENSNVRPLDERMNKMSEDHHLNYQQPQRIAS